MATDTVPGADGKTSCITWEDLSAVDDRTRYACAHDHAKAGSFGLCVTRCIVAPTATAAELMEDAECLFGSALSALEAMTDTAVDACSPPELSEPWFAMLYTMRQARTLFVHVYDRVMADEPQGGRQ